MGQCSGSLVFEQQRTKLAGLLEAAPARELVLPCITALVIEKVQVAVDQAFCFTSYLITTELSPAGKGTPASKVRTEPTAQKVF